MVNKSTENSLLLGLLCAFIVLFAFMFAFEVNPLFYFEVWGFYGVAAGVLVAFTLGWLAVSIKLHDKFNWVAERTIARLL